jgi:hypothetical protein
MLCAYIMYCCSRDGRGICDSQEPMSFAGVEKDVDIFPHSQRICYLPDAS